jgi:hypothetical protein
MNQLQLLKRANFVGLHLAAETDHVGGDDSG